MKITLYILCVFAAILAFVQAGPIEDALKKFCGGISITAPKKGQTFSNPKQVKITVTRKPNAEAKVIQAVDAYSIDSKGKVKYLTTIWKGNYALDKKASLTVNLAKVKNIKFPGQFELRVWVNNKSGPHCTYMSAVFKVKSSSHQNGIEEAEFNSLSEDIDRGCFGLEIVTPTAGARIESNQAVSVEIHRDTAAHVEVLTGLELYKLDLETRETTIVHSAWSGSEDIQNIINFKDIIPSTATSDNAAAYFYKVKGTTQHQESCEFFSHPFYVDL